MLLSSHCTDEKTDAQRGKSQVTQPVRPTLSGPQSMLFTCQKHSSQWKNLICCFQFGSLLLTSLSKCHALAVLEIEQESSYICSGAGVEPVCAEVPVSACESEGPQVSHCLSSSPFGYNGWELILWVNLPKENQDPRPLGNQEMGTRAPGCKASPLIQHADSGIPETQI